MTHQDSEATRLAEYIATVRPGAHGHQLKGITILVALLNQRRLPLGRFVPEPWPQTVHPNTQRGTPEMPLAA
jgi:hypothetical protein